MKLGCARGQAASRRPLSSEAWVQSQVSPCKIFGGKSGTGTGFSPREIQISIFSIVPPMFLALSLIYTLLLTEGQKGDAWEPFPKQYSFGAWGHRIEENLHFFRWVSVLKALVLLWIYQRSEMSQIFLLGKRYLFSVASNHMAIFCVFIIVKKRKTKLAHRNSDPTAQNKRPLLTLHM